jgi:hypothetical protein
VQNLFLVGTFENFDYEGGWNGYLPGIFSRPRSALGLRGRLVVIPPPS